MTRVAICATDAPSRARLRAHVEGRAAASAFPGGIEIVELELGANPLHALAAHGAPHHAEETVGLVAVGLGPDAVWSRGVVDAIEVADLVIADPSWVSIQRLTSAAHCLPWSELDSVGMLAPRGLGLDAGRVPGWLRLAWSDPAPTHGFSVPERGVGWARFCARRPFHPERLPAALSGFGDPGDAAVRTHDPVAGAMQSGAQPRAEPAAVGGVLRARGWAWIAGAESGNFAVDGVLGDVTLRPCGRWWATAHPIKWPAIGTPARAHLDARWSEETGDRRQEIVLVGEAGVLDAALESLESALLSEEERAIPEAMWYERWPFREWPWQSPARRAGTRKVRRGVD